jgi:hypothetical protein
LKKKEKINEKKRKNRKVEKKKERKNYQKRKKNTVDYCCNSQCFVCGETVISPYHLEYVII